MVRRFFLLVALSACGGGPPTQGSNQCSYSGSLVGNVPCRLADAAFTVSSNDTLFHVRSTTVASPVVSVEFGFSGEPGPGNFKGAAVDCVIAFTDVTAKSDWYATTLPTERNGTCELTLGTVKQQADEGARRTYELHGTFAATLAPGNNATGNVELLGGF